MAKNAGNSSKKKVGNKSRISRPRPATAGKKRSIRARGRHPGYVLIIMGLLTALVLLVNKFYDKSGAVRKKDQYQAVDSGDREKHIETRKEPEKKIEKDATAVHTDVKDTLKKETPQTKLTQEKPDTEEIKLYFIQFNEKTEKIYLSSVNRRVEKKPLLENTIKELIKGPTQSEKKKGLLTAVPINLKLNGVKLRNNVAELDFNSAIERGANGSILLNRIDQIVYTATQFPTVSSVIIKINGRKQETLGADGLSIGGPIHRRK